MIIEILDRMNNFESVLRLSSRRWQGRDMTVDSRLGLARGISESWAEQWQSAHACHEGNLANPGWTRQGTSGRPGVRRVILCMVRQVLRKICVWIGWNIHGGSVGDLGKEGLEAAERSKAAREQSLLASGLVWRRNRCTRRILRTRFGAQGKLSYIKW